MSIFLSKSDVVLIFQILHLDYCSVVWHNCNVVLTSTVECIQKYALSVILKKTSRSDTKEMCSQLSVCQHHFSCAGKVAINDPKYHILWVWIVVERLK